MKQDNLKLLAMCFLSALIMSYFADNANAQQTPPDQYIKSISPVTPNAASLGQYGDVPVSMYTGIPNIQIPIYQIQAGDITIPVNLSYHSGGVKVEDYCSWIGTGWSLNAGGVINREQRGDPDENMIDNYASNQADFNQLLNPSVSASTKQSIAYNHMSNGTPLDMESDIFNYNFGGASGKFFMDATGKIYPIGANKFKIQQDGRVNLTNTPFNSVFKRWIITDNKGIKYYFGSNSINTVNTQEIVTNTASGAGSTSSINSWYLTQIISPGRDTINFNYQAYSYSTAITISNSEYPGLANFTSTSILNYASALRLTSIVYPNGKITFTPGGNRQDLPGDQVLDHISIFETTRGNTYKLLKTFRLSTNNPTGISNTAAPDLYFRLCLDSVNMYSADNKKNGSYILTYNNFSLLPSRTSNAQDLWGYYNGQTGNSTLVPKYTVRKTDGSVYGVVGDANRGADSVYSTYGVLTSITYPTGGTTTFNFETNRATVMQDSLLNFFISSASSVINKSYTFKLPDTTGVSIQASSGNFTVGIPLPASTWNFVGHVLPYGNNSCGNLPRPNINDGEYYNPCFTAWIVGTQTDGTAVNNQILYFNNNTTQVFPGTYHLVIKFNAGSTGQAYVTANWQEQPSAQSQSNEWYVGGLRIRSMTNYDAVTNNVEVKTYKYTYSNNTRSSGTVENLPVFAYNVPVDIIGTNYYSPLRMIASHSQSPLLTTQGSIVGYANVIEQIDNSGVLGENIYTYTSDDYFANDPSLYEDGGIGATVNFPFPESTNYDWKRGLLKQKQVLANSGSMLNTVSNTMSSYIFSSPTDVNYVAVPNIKFTRQNAGIILNKYYVPGDSPGDLVYRNLYSIYYTTSGSVYNDTTREQIFDNLKYTNSTTKVSTQLLDPLSLENSSTSVSASNGKTVIKQMKYPLNYNITTAADNPTLGLLNLINNNKVKQPVEILDIVSDALGNQTVTGGTLLFYYKDKPEIQQVYTLNVVQPIPIAAFTQSSVNASGNFIYDSRYVPRLSADRYTAKLKLAQETKSSSEISTYVWDYNGEVPVATITNADSTNIAYTSFEADGAGNWTFNSAGKDTTQGLTGKNSYVLSTGAISRSGLTGTKTYLVSYWTKNTAPLSITGTIAGYPRNGATLNGWTYHEHQVTGQTTVTLSGSGNIDEVRLYPNDAQMNTYTYDPLVGITSASNSKNQLTYYEYDTFQRLINIRDQNGNIVKHTDYHYQGQ